jgi:hypothetical protein
MAQYMTKRAFAVMLIAVHSHVLGEEFTDPTRPPQAVLKGPVATEPTQPAALVLQSVLMSPNRTEAVVSGKLVHKGDRIGSATVTGISETAVALHDQHGGLQTLKLFPGVEKRVVEAGSSKPADVARDSQDKSKK